MKLLLPQQKDAYAYARNRDNIALFMEPRTGKTLPAIRWTKRKAGKLRVLVVAPLSILRSWQRELTADGVCSKILEGSSELKLDILECTDVQWYLVNPEGVVHAPKISQMPWAVVIVDESTFIKNPRAKTTKLFLKKFRHVPHKAILTGMANPEGPEDYVCQMIFAFGQFMGYDNFWSWRNRWMEQTFFGWEVPNKCRQPIRDAVRESAFLLTASAAGCFLPKIYETRDVRPSNRLAKLYREVEKDWAADGAETRFSVKKETWLAQLAAGVVPADFEGGPSYCPNKAKEAVKFVRDELGREQVIIWSRFTPEARGVYQTFKSAGIKVGQIGGSTKPSDREKIRTQFERGRLQVVVCQPKIAAKGLDFSAASVAFFTSNYWDLETRIQCLERTNHPLKSREKPTLVIDFITPDTVDEDISAALAGKWKSTRFFIRNLKAKIRRKHV